MKISLDVEKMGTKVVVPVVKKAIDLGFLIVKYLGYETLSLEAKKDVSKEPKVIIEESYTGVPLTEFKDQKKYEIFEKIYGKGYLEENKDELYVFTF